MNVVEIIFSPTGGTEKVADMISRQWSKNAVRIDLSDSQIDFTKCEINKEDMVLVAMPSFGGRAPAVAIDRLKQITGNGARCTLACVYGNRAYEDTLVEMEDAAKECGFKVIAAIAAVAEHSIIQKYAAKSGRIPTAAAFVGTKLNLKPVMKIFDRSITTASKCRGERKLVEKIAELSIADMEPGTPYEIVYGNDVTCLEEMRQLILQKLGYEPAATYQIGAAVAANSGPKVVGIAFTRKIDE